MAHARGPPRPSALRKLATSTPNSAATRQTTSTSRPTDIATRQGFVYVALVVDAYARRLVGWRASRTAHAGFVLDALEQALHDRRPLEGDGLVHHSGSKSARASCSWAA